MVFIWQLLFYIGPSHSDLLLATRNKNGTAAEKQTVLEKPEALEHITAIRGIWRLNITEGLSYTRRQSGSHKVIIISIIIVQRGTT